MLLFLQKKHNMASLIVPLMCAAWMSFPAKAVGQGDKTAKFGYITPPHENGIDEIKGFPSAIEFFNNYVSQSKPLVMKGAAKSSPAYERWKTDSYFLNLDIPEDELFTIETKKKENRTQDILDLNFKEFLESYQKEERYMVHHVPDFLGADVIVPDPLQCDDIIDNSIVEAIMWFSSGGTKSVVHTDSVDNINCVYSGKKHFVMIDPHRFADKVDFDHPEGAYSDIDVDNVDYDRYPGLLAVDYKHVDLDDGDCFYIPYKWIHQVRSFGPRNIAINIWWDTHRNKDVDFTRCKQEGDPLSTLNDVQYIGFESVLTSIEAVSDQFHDFTRHRGLSLETYTQMMLGDRDPEEMGAGIGYTIPLRQLYRVVDKDGDGVMTHEEVKQVSDDGWREVQKQMTRFDAILAALDEKWAEEHRDEHDRDEL